MFSRLLLSLACAVLLVFALLGRGVSAADPDVGPAAPVRGADNDTTSPFNVVDIPALFSHSYDGGHLVLGRVVETGAGWSRRAVSYRSEGLRITGTLITQDHSSPRPVVVTLHGYVPPGRYVRGAGLSREERRLADAGFVVLHPDYRNFAGSTRENGSMRARPLGYPSDVVNAILALRAAHLEGVDAGRTGLLGRSMGGGVAMEVAEARPDLVDALVLYSSVSASALDNYRRWVAPAPRLRARVQDAFGTPSPDSSWWREASPATYVARIDVPVQIHHGLADRVCPARWSGQTAEDLRSAGKRVALYTYRGQPHRFDDRAWPRFMARALGYFRSQLR